MKRILRFFPVLVVLQVVLAASFVSAQAATSTLMPVSRLAEIKEVKWMALQSARKAVVDLRPTLTVSAARLKLAIPGYEVGAIRQENMDFSRFDVPGAGVTPVVGKPELPIIRRFVAVPEGARVSVKFNAGTPKLIGNVNVYPVQEPLPEQQGRALPERPIKFAIDRKFYGLDQNYPGNLVTVSKPMKLRNVTVVMVEMAAMQYNPGRKTLSVYSGMDVDLTFSKPFEAVPKAMGEGKPAVAAKETSAGLTEENKAAAQKPPYAYMGDKIIVNWDWIKDLIAHLKWHYLIITPDKYYDEIQPLAKWKRDKGLFVAVTKLSSIGAAPTATQIRDYIKKAYENHAVEYVLLVGDTDTLPGYYYTDAGGTITDYYYALVTESGGVFDYLPDLAVGRFSGRSKAEITHMVAKSVNYEKTPLAGPWKSRALCISDAGYFQITSDHNHDLLEAHGFTTDKLYASLGNATAANTAAAINNGRLLVSYRGHGSPTGWNTTGFSNTDVNALSNGAKLPVIISPTCLTGEYDYATSDCYSETWVKGYGATAPLGAAAYWGSARVSYGGYNDELSKGAFQDILESGDHVIGNVVNNAKLHMLNAYGADGTALLELHMFNLFGDPGLQISFP